MSVVYGTAWTSENGSFSLRIPDESPVTSTSGVFALRAVMSGRGDEVIDVAKTNLLSR